MERVFNLRGTEKAFFNMYVGIMGLQSPMNKLRKQERQVLAEIMYQNSIISKDYKNPEDPKKWKAIFSYENKIIMAENVSNMSEASFANCLTSLRKYGLLDGDNYLHSNLKVYPNKKNGIVFNFAVKDAGQIV